MHGLEGPHCLTCPKTNKQKSIQENQDRTTLDSTFKWASVIFFFFHNLDKDRASFMVKLSMEV